MVSKLIESMLSDMNNGAYIASSLRVVFSTLIHA